MCAIEEESSSLGGCTKIESYTPHILGTKRVEMSPSRVQREDWVRPLGVIQTFGGCHLPLPSNSETVAAADTSFYFRKEEDCQQTESRRSCAGRRSEIPLLR
jgi:hypothetical protein